MEEWGPKPATAHELTRAYTRRYPDRSSGWFVLADILAGFARYAEAAAALRRAERVARSEKWRESPAQHFAEQWGLFYDQKKDFKRAELSFRRAVSLRPSCDNLTRLGEVLLKQGRLPEAKRCLTRAIRLGSDDPSPAHYLLGVIARARRQYREALRCLNKAIDLSPTYPLARRARRDVQRAEKLMLAWTE